MGRYKKPELEMSPQLVHKLFEHAKRPDVSVDDLRTIVSNLITLSSCDEMLTMEEFELAIQNPMTI